MKTLDFSGSFLVCDLKVGRYMLKSLLASYATVMPEQSCVFPITHGLHHVIPIFHSLSPMASRFRLGLRQLSRFTPGVSPLYLTAAAAAAAAAAATTSTSTSTTTTNNNNTTTTIQLLPKTKSLALLKLY